MKKADAKIDAHRNCAKKHKGKTRKKKEKRKKKKREREA